MLRAKLLRFIQISFLSLLGEPEGHKELIDSICSTTVAILISLLICIPIWSIRCFLLISICIFLHPFLAISLIIANFTASALSWISVNAENYFASEATDFTKHDKYSFSSYNYEVHGYNGHDHGYYHKPPLSTVIDDRTRDMFSDENAHGCPIMWRKIAVARGLSFAEWIPAVEQLFTSQNDIGCIYS